jgi:hypothetical protein
MAKQTPSLSQGAERLSNVVREVRERQHELSGTSDLEAPAQSPSEAWARKYLSEGFGPDAPASIAYMPGAETPSPTHQAQFMRELKAKAAEGHKGTHGASYGKMAMQRPFAPKAQPKRSMWSRMLRGK